MHNYRTPFRYRLQFILLCAWIAWSSHTISALLTTRLSSSLALRAESTNSTPNSLATLPFPDGIECFPAREGTEPPTFAGCRPTLNEIHHFPKYRRIQRFENDKWPKEPSVPPFSIHHHASNCLVLIATLNPSVTDRFSFEQVKGIAQDIIEQCSPTGCLGGVSPIGSRVGWTVTVYGTSGPPTLPLATNTTVLLDDLRSEGNASIS